MEYKHTPVMLKEVLEFLNPQVGQYFIDCTLGGAGYTMAIAKKIGSQGKIIAIDLDKIAIDNAKKLINKKKIKNIILENDNFNSLSKIVKKYFPARGGFAFSGESIKFNGIVFDLGLSSAQLADRDRGFSFQLDAPLNMSFAHNKWPRIEKQTATNNNTEYIVNNWRVEELEKIIREYGEEKFAKRIARKIVEYRKLKPIKTTGQLVEIINQAVPAFYKNKKINCATKTFQALRIATNNELENLSQALPQALDLLAVKGRIAVISYHSLEDRIVKNFFKQESRDCLCPPACPVCQCKHKAKLKILTRRIVRAGKEEAISNPRSRSAKLRVAERI